MTRTSINFLKWKYHALALSLAVILVGAWLIAARGLRLGVEFTGGTAAVVQFAHPPSLPDVRRVLVGAFGPDVILYEFGPPGARQVMVRLPLSAGDEDGEGGAARALERALRKGGSSAFTIAGSEYIGPAVGDELRTRGLSATALSLGGILAYLTVRYRFGFAVGAVTATVHDLLITMSCLAFLDYDITLNVVAALLTVAGYSSNDTIVVFDRVREELGRQRAQPMATAINTAINQTLSRTIITAGVTLLAVVSLFLFGGDVLRGFSFTLIVGIISGTYSTVFIAGTVAALRWGRAAR